MAWRIALVGLITLILAVSCFDLSRLWKLAAGSSDESDTHVSHLRILAYTSFVAAWGPGPKLAQLFEKQTGTKVTLLQADDANMLLAKMDAFPVDLVIGFDQETTALARASRAWRDHDVQQGDDSKFLAYDWAPIGFVYREGEIAPPRGFEDLLHPRFVKTITLQDPRSSSPGYLFLHWLVSEMGEEQAFAFLAKLRPNIQTASGSWSQTYGIFSRGLAKLALSYASSPLYHLMSEKNDRYRFAKFEGVSHPIQIEYAAVPESCRSCGEALRFMDFLVSLEAQKAIMTGNWMFPVNPEAVQGTPFEAPFKELVPATFTKPAQTSQGSRDRLMKKWGEVGL
jgi:thiamine transport system substrate-binding protein